MLDRSLIYQICSRRTSLPNARYINQRKSHHRLVSTRTLSLPRPQQALFPLPLHGRNRSHDILKSNYIVRRFITDLPAKQPINSPVTRPNAARSCSTSASTTTQKRSMPPASDEEYAAFLEKADNDASGSATTSSAGGTNKKNQFTTNSVTAAIPTVLSKIDRDYTSDSDERFEVVSLEFGGEGDTVGVGGFKELCGHEEVTALGIRDFDPRGDYTDVVDAVKKAGNGEVEVFKVALSGARCEYWVVSVDKQGKRLVGLRAGAVES